MIDPENVLIRCPQGHELQAARADLNKPLACPVCNVTFTPSAAEPGSPPAVLPPSPTGVEGAPAPVTMGYADAMLTKPIAYPGFTNWMLGLWIATTLLNAIFSVITLISPPTIDPQAPNIGMAIGSGLFGCVNGGMSLAAVILQLMWIHRVHTDARRAKHYEGVSPGLALGLSFIPIFNYIWTGLTMKKLAAFANTSDREDRRVAEEAVKMTGLCFILGIIYVLTTCITLAIMVPPFMEMMKTMTQGGGQAMDQAALQKQMTDAIPASVQLLVQAITIVGMLVYVFAVRKLEASLYPFLGAPNR